MQLCAQRTTQEMLAQHGQQHGAGACVLASGSWGGGSSKVLFQGLANSLAGRPSITCCSKNRLEVAPVVTFLAIPTPTICGPLTAAATAAAAAAAA
eukprot:CAMPEP_0202376728 /NCGR_PEP_ID=MMETSP1127-20130417/7152_1 /ASSEMBLY_ACC=CAM_ASM_000462 /TAXON_ID=3047 /ORGANISM="Dunaliella tertiolecta, Strain CCMP1320" /LENGTH=95 /DNA_ID=CAMNT_0048974585 /DNA_START=163 /DNA_END=447 /DNA_ORIENTATION=+